MLVLWDPDATIEELTAVVTGDPSLTAQVIRAANSARSFPVEPVSTARDAVVRLGLNGVRRLMSAAVADEQFRRLEHGPADADELWRYSIATAVLAEVLAPGAEERVIAFTAGLLHDLGRLALMVESPSRFGVVVEAGLAGVDPLEVERTQFGASHTEAGLAIAASWRMPERLAVALENHHDEGATGLAWTVGIARQAALHAGYTDGVPSREDAVTPEPALAALEAIGGPRGLGERIRWFRNAASAR
jgi:HD-like signal output (HDOD) protein